MLAGRDAHHNVFCRIVISHMSRVSIHRAATLRGQALIHERLGNAHHLHADGTPHISPIPRGGKACKDIRIAKRAVNVVKFYYAEFAQILSAIV